MMGSPTRRREKRAMQRVNAFYLYQVGNQIHPLSELKSDPRNGTPVGDAFFPLLVAEGALEPLLARSVFQLKTSAEAGYALLAAIKKAAETVKKTEDTTKPLPFMEAYQITSALQTFEAVLGAELALMPLYLVTQKAGFDTSILIERGAACFPEELALKVPAAVPDVQQGTRCIAFDLPTAAGFHLHRANESVLGSYWDVVTKGQPRPDQRNMGVYLREMDNRNVGDLKVKAALRDLKDLHRNPLIHPEHSLESVDEAIALMNSIHTVVLYMLKEIPTVAAAPSVGGMAPAA
jgi:hypothetical protein